MACSKDEYGTSLAPFFRREHPRSVRCDVSTPRSIEPPLQVCAAEARVEICVCAQLRPREASTCGSEAKRSFVENFLDLDFTISAQPQPY